MSVDLVAMRHRRCGGIALYLSGATIDNPGAAFMVRDMLMPDGREPRAGEELRCGYCDQPIGPLGPRTLAIDRGPDRRQSKLQALTLWLTTRILGWPEQSTRGI